MQTYLKTRPVWVQLLLFLGMSFGILMVVFLIGGIILSKISGISLLEMGSINTWDSNDPNMLLILRGMIVLQFLGLFLIPSLLFAYFSDPHPLRYLGLKKPSKIIYWVLGIAVMLIAIPLVEYTGVLNKQFPFNEGTQKWMQGMEEEAAKTIQFMLAKNSVTDLILNLILIALFAGVGEELFFRGVLQRLFIKAFKNPWAGIIVTAFLFSFFHFQFFGFIPRFLLGILLGAVYWYSGSLWPAIIAHFVYDAFFIVLTYFQPQLIESTEATLIDPSRLAIMALLSAAIVVTIVWWMKKNSITTYEGAYASDKPNTSEKDFTF
jgi:membrane protease YdiL (CAAX protease family)